MTKNLVIVESPSKSKTIEKYLEKLELNKKQLQKVNEFRTQLELQEIA